jgi:hypothetical protein
MKAESELASALRRYESVATLYQKRMVKEFVETVRADFSPRPATLSDQCLWDEDQTQQEGYTLEGAISRCVHREALFDFPFDLGPDVSAAGWASLL